jgi:uncharacterized protein
MRLPFIRMLNELRGRSARRFVELLVGHVEATQDGVRLVARAARGEMDWTQAREEMRAVEQRGDDLRASLGHDVALAIVTPIDREDLSRISRSIDEVLDNLRDFIRECDLFEIGAGSAVVPVIAEIDQALTALHEAISTIVDEPPQITPRAYAAEKAANRVRRAYDYALAELFRGQLSMDVLKVREVLRRLDVVGLRLGAAADALADAAVKRSAD